jgi:hypothetical protein
MHVDIRKNASAVFSMFDVSIIAETLYADVKGNVTMNSVAVGFDSRSDEVKFNATYIDKIRTGST